MKQVRQKNLLLELKKKKEGVCPVEARLGEKYRDAACHCMQNIHVAKTQLELKLPGHTDGKIKCKNNINPLQDEDGHLTNREGHKAEMFNTFLALVFNTDYRPRGAQCPELEHHDWDNDQFTADPEVVLDQLLQLDSYISMGPFGVHPRTLKDWLMSSQNFSQ